MLGSSFFQSIIGLFSDILRNDYTMVLSDDDNDEHDYDYVVRLPTDSLTSCVAFVLIIS